MDLALDNLQLLICHKTISKPNQTKERKEKKREEFTIYGDITFWFSLNTKKRAELLR